MPDPVTILVEWRDDPRAGPILDGLARAVVDLGRGCVRWRHGTGLPHGVPGGDLAQAIVWNGLTPEYDELRAEAEYGLPVLYAELGWLPHDTTFQLDPQGVNALASWADEPVRAPERGPLPVRDGDLLVLLQWDDDQQIRHLSPWFESMAAWLRFLDTCVRGLPMVVRPHPAFAPGLDVLQIVERSTRMRWDGSATLAEALAGAAAVATINSSAAVQALAAGLPVLCYGRAVYRHWPAVWTMGPQPEFTTAAIRRLRHRSEVAGRGAVAAIVERIMGRQWRLDDLPWRLAPLLAGPE